MRSNPWNGSGPGGPSGRHRRPSRRKSDWTPPLRSDIIRTVASFTPFYARWHSPPHECSRLKIKCRTAAIDASTSDNVRYRFRSDDHDVNVIIRGPPIGFKSLTNSVWRASVGPCQLVRRSRRRPLKREHKRQEAGINIRMDGTPEDQRPADMGPEPDPPEFQWFADPLEN